MLQSLRIASFAILYKKVTFILTVSEGFNSDSKRLLKRLWFSEEYKRKKYDKEAFGWMNYYSEEQKHQIV